MGIGTQQSGFGVYSLMIACYSFSEPGLFDFGGEFEEKEGGHIFGCIQIEEQSVCVCVCVCVSVRESFRTKRQRRVGKGTLDRERKLELLHTCLKNDIS